MEHTEQVDVTNTDIAQLVGPWFDDGLAVRGRLADSQAVETYSRFDAFADAVLRNAIESFGFVAARQGQPLHCIVVSESRWDEFVECLGMPRYDFQRGGEHYVPVQDLHFLRDRPGREKLPKGISIGRQSLFDEEEFELVISPESPIPRVHDVVVVVEKLSGEGESLLPDAGAYQCRSGGVFVEVRKKPKCCSTTPIWVEAPAQLLHAGCAGLNVLFFTEDGVLHSLPIAREDIMRDTMIARQLISQGAGWLGTTKLSDYFAQQLIAAKGAKPVKIADRTGWLQDGDTLIFSTGSDLFVPSGKEQDYVLLAHPDTVFHQRGDLNDWQTDVFGLVRGNLMGVGLICIGFGSLLMPFLGTDNGLFHICGWKGGGKTTLLQVVASLFGNGAAPGQGQVGDGTPTYMRKHHATANGLEGLAEKYDGAVLLTDEVGEAAGGSMGKTVYQLSSGLGKATMSSSRQLKKQSRWNLNIISTGEVSMQDVIIAAEGAILGGQQDRAADLKIGAEPIFTDFHGYADFGAYAGALKQACATSYGTPCIELVRYAVDNPEALIGLRSEVEVVAARLRPAGVDDGAMRIVRRFAAAEVAGKIAIAAGVIDCEPHEIEDAMAYLVALWHRGKIEPIQRIAEYCTEHIADCAAHIDPSHGHAYYVQRSGKNNGFRPVVAIPVGKFEEHFGDSADLIIQLDAAGLLIREQAKRHKHRFGNNKLFAYAIDWKAVRDAMGGAGGVLPMPMK